MVENPQEFLTLTDQGTKDIKKLFKSFDQDGDNLLSEEELEDSFKIGAYNPFENSDYFVQKNNGKYSMDSWISLLK